METAKRTILIVSLIALNLFLLFWGIAYYKDVYSFSIIGPIVDISHIRFPFGWQIYESEDYKFKIKYPRFWNYASTERNEADETFIFSNGDLVGPKNDTVYVVVYVVPGDEELQELLLELRGVDPGDTLEGTSITKINDITVDEFLVTKYSVERTSPSTNISIQGQQVLLEREDTIFAFALMGESQNAVDRYSGMFNRMLNTFEFTDTIEFGAEIE